VGNATKVRERPTRRMSEAIMTEELKAGLTLIKIGRIASVTV
jgi:hypothetical protein